MRQHPYYAGLHYDKSMTDFLTLEWASFRLRELDDEATKKSPATLREGEKGKVTVEWGKARSVGPCSSAGRLDRMHECDRSEGMGGGSEETMRCTRIPGLLPSMLQEDQDAGAGMLGNVASLCMNATESLKHCSDEMFLCTVGHGFRLWERSGRRAHLESALHAWGKMQPAGAAMTARRNGVLDSKAQRRCFRKIDNLGIVAKVDDGVCAPDKQLVGASYAVALPPVRLSARPLDLPHTPLPTPLRSVCRVVSLARVRPSCCYFLLLYVLFVGVLFVGVFPVVSPVRFRSVETHTHTHMDTKLTLHCALTHLSYARGCAQTRAHTCTHTTGIFAW